MTLKWNKDVNLEVFQLEVIPPPPIVFDSEAFKKKFPKIHEWQESLNASVAELGKTHENKGKEYSLADATLIFEEEKEATHPMVMEEKIEAMTDELITLHKWKQDHKVEEIEERIHHLKGELQSIANEHLEPGVEAHFTSQFGEIIFSKRVEKTVVVHDFALLKYILGKYGPDVLVSVMKFGITSLKNVLAAHELKDFVKQEQGTRSLKAVKPNELAGKSPVASDFPLQVATELDKWNPELTPPFTGGNIMPLSTPAKFPIGKNLEFGEGWTQK